MHEWFIRQVKTGFPAFAGSELSGTLAIRQELINELLAEWLAGSHSPATTTSGEPFAQLVTAVKRAAVRAEAGVIFVDFEIRI